MEFQKFMDQKNDNIDNTAYGLLNLLANTNVDGDYLDGNILDWDMQMIGDLIEEAVKILREHRCIEACWPYKTDDNKPCHCDEDCDRKDCQFRK